MTSLSLLAHILVLVVPLVAVAVLIAGVVQNLKTNFIHQVTHNNLNIRSFEKFFSHFYALFGRATSPEQSRQRARQLTRFMVEWLGIIVIAPPVDEYRRSHIGIHHRADKVASLDDEDTQFVQSLGFDPGLSVALYWHKLHRVLFSPVVHVRLFLLRVSMNLKYGSWWRRIGFILWWALVLTVAGQQGLLFAVIVGYLTAIGPVFQIAQILQAITEHMHFANPGGQNDKQWHAKVSHARFVGSMAPAEELHGAAWLYAWSRFWLEVVFIHLPVRWMILPGELATHAAHHWWAGRADWTLAPYSYRDLKAQVPEHWVREYWGLKASLNAVFEGMADADSA